MKEEEIEGYLNGWHAHRVGLTVHENPYNENTMHISYMNWVTGWCARFSAIKHGLSLELDEKQL